MSIHGLNIDVDRIYLDNAATSWPKPNPVSLEVQRFLQDVGFSMDRSTGDGSQSVADVTKTLRKNLSSLFGCKPDIIHFPFGATDGLNLIISGFLHSAVRKKNLQISQPLDEKIHFITTAIEHNSILRPLNYWKDFGWIDLTILPCDEYGNVDIEDFKKAIRPQSAFFAISHASGVSGAIQKVEDFGEVCRENGIFFLLDAAQTAGSHNWSFDSIGCHAAVASGHKSLLGPMGTGVMMIDQEAEGLLDPMRLGGTGTQSHLPEMPTDPKTKWSAGHNNIPGLYGLAASTTWLVEQDLHQLRQQAWLLCCYLVDELQTLDGFRVIGNWNKECHSISESTPVVSLVHDFLQPAELAVAISRAGNITCRAGYHCAPLIHSYLSSSNGGTLRLSPGFFSSEQDILTTVEVLAEVSSL